VILSFYILLKYIEVRKFRIITLAGFIMGLSLLTRQEHFSVMVSTLISFIVVYRLKESHSRRIFGYYLLGFILFLIPFLLYNKYTIGFLFGGQGGHILPQVKHMAKSNYIFQRDFCTN
jgi:cell division protein FtsW (lipid II flippase)